MTEKKIYTDIHHDLIESCRNNDRKAQIEIYKLYYQAMFNSSLRIVNSRSDAEDLMQESFLDAFSKIGRYSETGSFGAWLKRIVINKSIDFLKAKKSFTRIDDAKIEFMEINDLEQDEEVANDYNFRLNEIKQGLEKLPDQYRAIVSLYLLEGYDHSEIARILNISYDNVRVRYIRAKRRLIKEITEKENQFSNLSKN